MKKGRLKSFFNAFLKGELVTYFKMDKLLPQIVCAFLIVVMFIYVKLKIEQTLVTVEKNKIELDSLRYVHSQKEYELVKLGRLGTIEQLLEEKGSTLTRPEKPAEIIEE